MYGNYKLPKHCDNNEVLKALCNEAGWVVEDDGLTYKKGMKPPERTPETGFAPSPFMSPASSSYPSPASSACPSPVRSSYGAAAGEGPSLIPWLKGLSSAKLLSYGGSYSAPVTPPLSSPTCRSPRARDLGGKSNDWDSLTAKSSDIAKDSAPADCAATALLNAWSSNNPPFYTSMVASCPPSPLMRSVSHDHKRAADIDAMEGEKALYKGAAASSTCSPSGMASPTPMGVWVAPWAGSSSSFSSLEKSHISMWRPGYSYVSPAASVCTGGGAGELYHDGGQKEVVSDPSPPVKAWAGEQIHEECPDVAPEDLELKL